MSKEIIEDITEDTGVEDTSTNSTTDKSNENSNEEFTIPEHLQGKSAEDMAKMILEGQRKITELSTKKETKSSDTTEDSGSEELGDILGEGTEESDTSTKDNKQEKGLDYDAIKQKFMEAKTEEEQNAALALIDKKKDSDVLKNTFKNSLIAEKQSILDFQKKAISEVHEAAGSREEFLNLMKVVKAELGKDEVNQFSATFKAGNVNSAKNLVEFYKYKLSDKLQGQTDSDKDNTGESFNGEAGGKAAPEFYKSKDEYFADLNSKAYKNNEKGFRAKVRAKHAASKFK